MTPGTYVLNLYRGDSYHWQFKLWQDTGKTTPADLTGAAAKAEIREKSGSTVLATLDCEIVLPNIIEVDLPAAMCASLPVKSLLWDLQLTYATGEVATIAAGAVKMTADITDSVVAPPLTIVARRA